MKKIILSALAVMLLASVSSAGDDFGAALKNGKFSVTAKVFYFNRNYSGGTGDQEALTAGGYIGYVSDDFNGLKVGATYFTNNSLDIVDRHRNNGTLLLESPSNKNINLMGEAYLEYNVNKFKIKVGRQILTTPILNRYEIRALPASHEAATIQSSHIPNTTVELGYVNARTHLGSKFGDFEKEESRFGDDGLGYLYVTNKSIDNLTLRAQYIKALSDEYNNAGVITKVAVTDYRYADLKYTLPSYGKKTYISVNYAGNGYESQDDSMMFGLKVGTTFGMFNVCAVYAQVFDNNFKYIDHEILYTSWQRGYGTHGPSKGLGAMVSFKPMKDLSVLTRFVNVSPDDYSSNASGTGKNYANDFTEFNFDTTYALNDWSKFRVRYANKNVSSAANSVGQYDVQDFRLMYCIRF